MTFVASAFLTAVSGSCSSELVRCGFGRNQLGHLQSVSHDNVVGVFDAVIKVLDIFDVRFA
jgi:hypothetical protein